MAEQLSDLTKDEFDYLSRYLESYRDTVEANRIRAEWKELLVYALPLYYRACVKTGDTSWSGFVNFWDALDPDSFPSGVPERLLKGLYSDLLGALKHLFITLSSRDSFPSKEDA